MAENCFGTGKFAGKSLHCLVSDDILRLVIHFTAFGTLLCALLLFLRRSGGDRSRGLLAVCFAFCGAVVLVRTLSGYVGSPLSNEVLLPSDLDSGLLTLLTGNTLVNALHIAYCMTFCLVVTYQELYLCIRVFRQTAQPEAPPLGDFCRFRGRTRGPAVGQARGTDGWRRAVA